MHVKLVIGCLLLGACGAAQMGPGTNNGNPSALVGSWFSEGADLAKGFGGPPFNFRSLDADYNADGSFTVKAIDAAGKSIMFSGTWAGTASATPGIFEITQNQIQPQAVVSKGIYQIDQAAGRMTFEMIQVQPDVGATPPTVMGGFGSTQVKGKATDAWVQKFVRQ